MTSFFFFFPINKRTSYCKMASWKSWHFWEKILTNNFNWGERDLRIAGGRDSKRKGKPGKSTKTGKCLCEHWVVMQDNLWEASGKKGWKGGRGGRERHGELDGEGEAWEVSCWGMESWTGSSYIVEVFLEWSISVVWFLPLVQHTLFIFSTASVTCLSGPASLDPTFWIHSLVAILELCWSGVAFWIITQATFQKQAAS